MKSTTLLALILTHLERRIEDGSLRSVRGPRGFRGRDGNDGKDGTNGKDGKDGTNGKDGKDGISFNFDTYKEDITAIISSLIPKEISLSDEDIAKLKGKDGTDGTSFNIDTYAEDIKAWIDERKPKLSDLTPEEIESLKGKDGKDGTNGKDGLSFNWDTYKEDITDIIAASVEAAKEDFKLKFSDLSEKDKEEIRGPKGRDGLGFKFEDHESAIWDLLQKNLDNRDLKLKFSDLSAEEVDSLRLTFDKLTEGQKKQLRGDDGARGARGPRGQRGAKGQDGLNGIKGLNGLNGKDGRDGNNGKDGIDGEDAPKIYRIELVEVHDHIYFEFFFTDGERLQTNRIRRPKDIQTYVVGGGVGGNGGGGQGSPLTVVGSGSEFEKVSTIIFDSDTMEVTGVSEGVVEVTAKQQEDPRIRKKISCEEDVEVGDVVFLFKTSAEATLSDWTPIAKADPLNYKIFRPRAGRASALTEQTSKPFGICIARYEEDGVQYCDIGRGIVYLNNLEVAEDYYLSEQAGKMEPESELVIQSGNYKVRVGVAETTEIFHYERGDRERV